MGQLHNRVRSLPNSTLSLIRDQSFLHGPKHQALHNRASVLKPMSGRKTPGSSLASRDGSGGQGGRACQVTGAGVPWSQCLQSISRAVSVRSRMTLSVRPWVEQACFNAPSFNIMWTLFPSQEVIFRRWVTQQATGPRCE